jgi:hypothetical protein
MPGKIVASRALAAVFTCGFILYFADKNFFATFRLDDDNLYYLISAVSAFSPEAFRDTFSRLLTCVQLQDSIGSEITYASRIDLRYHYIGSYTFMSALWGLLYRGIASFGSDVTVIDANGFKFAFQLAQAVIITAGIALVALSREWAKGLLAVGVAATACALLASLYTPANYLTRGDPILSLKFVLTAPSYFNIFHFAPRGVSALVLVVACVLRWQLNFRVFYALLILLCFIHQSNATLIILTFVGLDALFRPAIFRDLVVSALVFCCAICIIAREELASIIGLPTLLVGFVALALLAVASERWAIADHITRLTRMRISVDVSDVLVIVAFWFVSMLVLRRLILHEYIDPTSGRFVFFQLHVRYGSLFLGVVCAGAGHIAARFLRNQRQTAGVAIALLVIGVAELFLLRPIPRDSQAEIALVDGLHDLHEASVSYWSTPRPILNQDKEQILYYSVVSDLLGKRLDGMPSMSCAPTKDS